ncbi:DUF6178 family protein [Anaeromyxobacter terrae]|uniref:DUF6178 family protein n=1 Tax=Anaeromyxobacter terrae TaxID=2925406 RepID=UPI001F570E98|nr:DUF6178 family protein [Anaeromyxobacter sp. SG22]
MAKENRTLAPAELRDARAALTVARGRKRLDVILDARDPQALVRALPADELYFTIRDVGLADAAEIVQLASAAQFKTFIDLDAWSRGGFEPRKVLPWLRAARAGAQLEPKAAARWERKLAALDREVLYLVLRTTLRIHDLEEDPDPELTSDRFMRTPENKYVVEFLVDGTEYMAVRGVLDDLYAEDPFAATRLLSSLRWDLPSELEETALRWRAARLADLGYPSLDEALSWFARPPRTPASAPGLAARPPGFFLATLAKASLLDRAFAALSPAERDGVERQIVSAANAVLVADAVDPGDLEAVRAAFEAARAYLELGLEKLAGGDEPRAAEALGETPVKRIFQEGFGRVLELRWRAERILAAAGGAERFRSPLSEMLAALVRRRPRYFPGIEAPREEWGTPMAAAFEPRHFRSSEDLSRTAAALDAAEAEAKS